MTDEAEIRKRALELAAEVAREFSPRVRYAARAAGVRLVTYGFSFTFSFLDEP